MYLPRQFQNTDPAVAQRVMREHPLAQVVTSSEVGLPLMSAIPMHWQAQSLWEDSNTEQAPHGYLLGHCALANPQSAHFRQERPALVAFMGPQAYMSPQVYPDLQRVPTWCYLAVQAEVSTRVVDPHTDKDRLLKCLIGDHEPAYAPQWRSLPEEYADRMLKGIVAFEMKIDRLQCSVKLNQHRPEAHAAMFKAYNQGTPQERALAAWMQDLGMVSPPETP